MIGISITEQMIDTCKRIVKYAPKIQTQARRQLVKKLQNICANCEDAYSAFLARLAPIKDSYGDMRQLAVKLRAFAADQETRRQFKPEHLRRQVDEILEVLGNNLRPLKYSIDVFGIRTVRELLSRIRFSDATLRHEYDEFASELDSIATLISESTPQNSELWRRYAEDLISSMQSKMNDAIMKVRAFKDEIVDIALWRQVVPQGKRIG